MTIYLPLPVRFVLPFYVFMMLTFFYFSPRTSVYISFQLSLLYCSPQLWLVQESLYPSLSSRRTALPDIEFLGEIYLLTIFLSIISFIFCHKKLLLRNSLTSYGSFLYVDFSFLLLLLSLFLCL